jgi:hypothetical protein
VALPAAHKHQRWEQDSSSSNSSGSDDNQHQVVVVAAVMEGSLRCSWHEATRHPMVLPRYQNLQHIHGSHSSSISAAAAAEPHLME